MANKVRTPLRMAMVVVEDAQGGVSEMGSRLGTVWPIEGALAARVKARCQQLEGDLRELRMALDRMERAA